MTTTADDKRPGWKCLCCKIIAILIGLILLLMILMYLFWFESLIKLINGLPGTKHLPDTDRNIFELIESRGFKHESHYVKTDSGYILLMVRIIHPFVEDRSTLKPVFLQHGLMTTGSFWLISNDGHLSDDGRTYYETIDDQIISNSSNGDVGNSLGFVLASRGYDVWLGNYRGCIYSRNHTTLDPRKDSEFWEFSVDQMIEEDLKANVDYIMQQTGRPYISYVGHSQGSLMMLALLAKHPRYSDHVRPFIAVSPVFYLFEPTTPLLQILPIKLTSKMLRKIGGRVPISRKMIVLVGNACENILLKRLCFWMFHFSFGSTLKHNIWDRIGVYWTVMFQGTSSWNFVHLGQMVGGQFKHFDYGDATLNIEKYGTETPPIYNASNINSTDIALIYSPLDDLNSIDDVEALKADLRVEPILDHLIPDETVKHLDQIRSNSSGRFVHSHVLDILSRY